MQCSSCSCFAKITRMNWVGGARSRVRQHAEKKIQKDFFERKRLANKIQQFRPSLSKVKTSISQDLLFLKATAASTKPRPPVSPDHVPKKPLSLEPGGGQKGGRLSVPPRPQRDLELPMSPIGQSSMLDIMDTSAALSEASEAWKNGGGKLGGEPPRVSTQKIPHRTLLESFGPPKIDEFDVQPIAVQEPCTVPAMDTNLLNVSAMTESLFPPPAKRHKQQGVDNKRRRQSENLDDILNQDYRRLDENTSKSFSKTKHVSAISRDVPSHQGRKRKRQNVTVVDGVGSRRDNCDSIFTIAKGGGWQRAEPKRELQQGLTKKSQFGFNFDSRNKRKSSHRDHGHRDCDRGPGGMEVVSSKDGEAVLEFHYATTTDMEGEERRRRRNGDSVGGQGNSEPSAKQELNQLVPDHGVQGRHRKKELDALQDKIVPWISSTKSTISVLSEDPFSKRKVPPLYPGPPVSTSMDFDESIFGPLRQMAGHGKKGTKCTGHSMTVDAAPECSFALDTTEYNESVLGPILGRKKGGGTRGLVGEGERRREGVEEGGKMVREGGKTLGKRVGKEGEGEFRRKERELQGGEKENHAGLSGTSKRKSTFEMMMASLEQTSKCTMDEEKRDKGMEGGMEGANRCGADPKQAKSNLGVPNPDPQPAVSHNSMVTSENASLPDSGSLQALPSEGSRERSTIQCSTSKFKFGNVSVLNELMCLEEEISSHYEDGLLSQNSPEEMGISEDPLFNRPLIPSKNSEVADCSQDFTKNPSISVSKITEAQCEPSSTKSAIEVGTQTSLDEVTKLMPNKMCAIADLEWACSSTQTSADLEKASSHPVSTKPKEKNPFNNNNTSDNLTVALELFQPVVAGMTTASSKVQKPKKAADIVASTEGTLIPREALANNNTVQGGGGEIKDDGATSIIDTEVKPEGQLLAEDSQHKVQKSLPAQENYCKKIDTGVAGASQTKIQELEEKLACAESTVVWQSIMLKLYQSH